MQSSDFTEHSPGRVVEIASGTWAFVSKPAPSRLDLDPATVHALGAAERAPWPAHRHRPSRRSSGQPTYERIEQSALYLSPHLERHRTQYTDLMLRVSRTGDYLSWVRFFLEAVEGSALESITRAEALLALRERYHAKLHSARSSALLLRMVDSLFERPSTSIGVAGEVMQVTPAAAAANLRKLVDAEILRGHRTQARPALRRSRDHQGFAWRVGEHAPDLERAD